MNDLEELLAGAEPDGNGCLIHNGFPHGTGYSSFRNGPWGQSAHRASFWLQNGEIPKGILVRHTCDVRRCIEKSHLILGTPKQNTADMDIRGRRSVTNRKYSDEQWDELVRLWKKEGVPRKDLSEEYKVHPITIQNHYYWRIGKRPSR